MARRKIGRLEAEIPRRQILKFARANLLASGIRHRRPNASRKLHRKGLETDQYRQLFYRLADVTGHMLACVMTKGTIDHPLTWHYAMLNGVPGVSSLAGQRRTAIPGYAQSVMPLAEEAENQLLNLWTVRVNTFITKMHARRKDGKKPRKRDAKEAQKLSFLFLFIRPFEYGNARMARMIHNVLLVCAGFPWRVPKYEESVQEELRYRRQRTEFIKEFGKYLNK